MSNQKLATAGKVVGTTVTMTVRKFIRTVVLFAVLAAAITTLTILLGYNIINSVF